MKYLTIFQEVRLLFDQTFQEKLSAYAHWPWEPGPATRAEPPLLRQEVQDAITQRMLLSPFDVDMDAEGARNREIARVAWLVSHWNDSKAHVLFSPETEGVVDGHHTLSAAVFLQKNLYFECPICTAAAIRAMPFLVDSTFRPGFLAQGKYVIGTTAGHYYYWDFQPQAVYLYSMAPGDCHEILGNCKFFSNHASVYARGAAPRSCSGSPEERLTLFVESLAAAGGPDFQDITGLIVTRAEEERCGILDSLPNLESGDSN